GRPRGGDRLGMGREGFRKHAVDSIGPTAVVLDNLVGHISHGTPFEYAGSEILSHLKINDDTTEVRPPLPTPPLTPTLGESITSPLTTGSERIRAAHHRPATWAQTPAAAMICFAYMAQVSDRATRTANRRGDWHCAPACRAE